MLCDIKNAMSAGISMCIAERFIYQAVVLDLYCGIHYRYACISADNGVIIERKRIAAVQSSKGIIWGYLYVYKYIYVIENFPGEDPAWKYQYDLQFNSCQPKWQMSDSEDSKWNPAY